MKKILFYGHANSENRGCQAIVESISTLLKQRNPDLHLSLTSSKKHQFSNQFECIDEVIVHDYFQTYNLKWAVSKVWGHVFHNQKKMFQVLHKSLVNYVKEYDLAISVGGDNYCYDAPGWLYSLNTMLHSVGVKTVLLGCSIEPEKMNEQMCRDLSQYSLIIAREHITYQALLDKKIDAEIVLAPDTAFLLDSQKSDKTKRYRTDNAIGINASALLSNYENSESIVFQNYMMLINRILDTTDLNILLIPHVFCESSNDYDMCKQIFSQLSDASRVQLVDKLDCKEIKYIISQCRMFMGGRTHATIAAYSSCVPTVVIGYSTKAKGIACDLFSTDENYVISTQKLHHKNNLAESFDWLYQNEYEIRCYLQNIMSAYMQNVSVALDGIEALLGECGDSEVFDK